MEDLTPREIELTPDLLEYAKAVALKEAPKHCGPRVDYDDVIQEAHLALLRKPPKFDPSRGANVKTLIYTIVQRAVIKYATRETHAHQRFREFPDALMASKDDDDEDSPLQQMSGRRQAELTRSRWNLDDVLQYIDNEASREMCRLVIECKGNISEAARRMKLSEGAVRHRLKLLAPKLIAAGFDPFEQGGKT
jgi:RNA polymerase sigma factor (sigma-70 family)